MTPSGQTSPSETLPSTLKILMYLILFSKNTKQNIYILITQKDILFTLYIEQFFFQLYSYIYFLSKDTRKNILETN